MRKPCTTLNWCRVKGHPDSCSCEYPDPKTIIPAGKAALQEYPYTPRNMETQE